MKIEKITLRRWLSEQHPYVLSKFYDNCEEIYEAELLTTPLEKAAPDMYEMLFSIEEDLINGIGEEFKWKRNRIIDEIRAVLAKARGEQS